MWEDSSTREIARRLNISQTTAARKVKAIKDDLAQMDLTRRVQIAQIIMFSVVSVCAVVITIAVVKMALLPRRVTCGSLARPKRVAVVIAP
jgi:hypothetical protein